jgi:hypothetical protein
VPITSIFVLQRFVARNLALVLGTIADGFSTTFGSTPEPSLMPQPTGFAEKRIAPLTGSGRIEGRRHGDSSKGGRVTVDEMK